MPKSFHFLPVLAKPKEKSEQVTSCPQCRSRCLISPSMLHPSSLCANPNLSDSYLCSRSLLISPINNAFPCFNSLACLPDPDFKVPFPSPHYIFNDIYVVLFFSLLCLSPSSQREGEKRVGWESVKGKGVNILSSCSHDVPQPAVHPTSIWSPGRAANALVWCPTRVWMFSQNIHSREENLFISYIVTAVFDLWKYSPSVFPAL